ncbi:MAG: HD domain-containing protein [archaeon]
MKEIFRRIWRLALPYQDKRDDKGHAQITLKYAEDLLRTGGDEGIVIPAIILHDTGWCRLSRKRRLVIFGDATNKEKMSARLQHQEEGVKVARDILGKVGYPQKKTDEILEIISQHDTRKGFISENEGLVRDADKLWRFSEAGCEADRRRKKCSFEDHFMELSEQMQRSCFFYSKKANEIAADELKGRHRW